MLDFRRDLQRRGPFPDVPRALAVYWSIEGERQKGVSYREAVRRMASRPPARSRGSVDYQYRKGAAYEAELQAVWGRAYPVLKAETLAAKKL